MVLFCQSSVEMLTGSIIMELDWIRYPPLFQFPELTRIPFNTFKLLCWIRVFPVPRLTSSSPCKLTLPLLIREVGPPSQRMVFPSKLHCMSAINKSPYTLSTVLDVPDNDGIPTTPAHSMPAQKTSPTMVTDWPGAVKEFSSKMTRSRKLGTVTCWVLPPEVVAQ